MYQGDEEPLGDKMTKSLLVFILLRIKSTDSFHKKSHVLFPVPMEHVSNNGSFQLRGSNAPFWLPQAIALMCAHTHPDT